MSRAGGQGGDEPVGHSGAEPGEAGVAEVVRSHLREVADFPRPGIAFKDLSPLLASPEATRAVVADIAGRYAGLVHKVAGIEARGFVLGAVMAYQLGVGFVPVRKAGKLPGVTLRADYDLEYGSASIEVQQDAIEAGETVLVLDDVLATGGTARASCELLARAGATVAAFEAVIELRELGGRARLDRWPVHSMLII